MKLLLAIHLSMAASLIAAGHRGEVKYGGLPLPGASVTASAGSKKFVAVSGPDGLYAIPDLADGTWQLQVEMLCFATLKRDVVVAAGAPAAEWDMKLLPLAEMNAIAAAPPAVAGSAPSGFKRAELKKSPEASPPREAASTENAADLAQRAADGFLINGSVNNGASSPFSLMPAFGNTRKGPKSMYNASIGLVVDNSALDARSFSLTGQDTPKPAYNRVTGLLSFGGPLKIPRLFTKGPNVVVNYQWTRNRNATTQSGLMPTAAERYGILSTGVIAPSFISAQAKALLRLYPLPNFDGSARYNYQIPIVSAMHQDNLQSRFNQSIQNKNQISGNFAYMSSRSDNQNIFQFLDTTNSSGVNAGVSYRRNITTRYFATLAFQYSKLSTRITPFFANRENFSATAGITGNDQSALNWGPPSLQFANGVSGLSDVQAALNRNQTADLSTSQFWSRGRHNVSFGAGYKRHQYNVLSQQDPRGSFTFTGADLAGFLSGIPDTSSIAFGNADKYLRAASYDAFATDDWRISPGFTLNAGMRWEYSTPVTERYGRLVNLAIAPGFTAQSPVIPADLHPDRRGFQPRIGISWRPFLASSMVIRTGYGVYYNSSVYQPIASQMSQQAPLSKSLSVQNSTANPLTLANGFNSSVGITPTTFAVDPDFRIGYSQNWQISIQRDLPKALVMTATYLGIKGTRGAQMFLPNTYPAGAVNPCTACPSGFTYLSSNGNSTREAGQLQLRRRLQKGFTASLQYTFAKSIDDAAMGGRGQGGQLIAQDWLNLRAERGLSNFDRRHLLNLTFQYTSGMGHRVTLLKEWTFASQINSGSGLPLTPIYPAAVHGTGVTGSIRPDYTGVDVYAAPSGFNLNPLAFAAPSPGHWGSAGRNSITGPGQFNLAASMGRTFRVGDRLNLDMRVDASNALNHVTYPNWNTTISSAQFGLPNSANAMRTVQTTLRLRF
jgi:trimeric autotransporter adhesin